MFDRTDFAAALLLFSLTVLPGCNREQVGSAATGGAPQAGDVAQGAPQAGSVAAGAPQVRVFSHPGAPLTASDLKTLKAYVDQGKQPWKSAYELLANDGMAKLTYRMYGPYATVGRAPDVNLWAWRHDMVAIWNLLRMWYFTGNEDYAKKARQILLAWATTQVEFSGRESMLDLGDYAYLFVGGADLRDQGHSHGQLRSLVMLAEAAASTPPFLTRSMPVWSSRR